MPDEKKRFRDNGLISRGTADKWIKNYYEWTNVEGSKVPVSSTLSSFFHRDVFERLLSQPGATGIRIHLGIKTDIGGSMPDEQAAEPGLKFILTATDVRGKDLRKNSAPDKLSAQERQFCATCGIADDEALIFDLGLPCPPYCDPNDDDD